MSKANPTLEELQAQRADLERKIAEQTLPNLKAAQELVQGAAVSSILTDAQELAVKLGDGATRQAITNIVQIIRAARNSIDRDVRNAELATAEEAPTASGDE